MKEKKRQSENRMKSKIYIRAYNRVISGNAEEAELKMLLLWAKKEIAEWKKFIELINDKLTPVK